jgi:periplasmic protein TonB
MFTNLIESDSHAKEFKRRSSFFAATVAAYALFLFAAAVAGVLTYDARVDAQTLDLEVAYWIPPVKPVKDTPREPRSTRRPAATNAPADPHLKVPMRTNPTAPVTDPIKAPDTIGTTASTEPPVTGPFVVGPKNADPPGLPAGTETSVAPTVTTPPIKKEDPPRVVEPVKPPTQTISSRVLAAKAVDLPKPAYPIIAKQMRAQGQVNVQILVDEGGRVVSAHLVSGNPVFKLAVEDAARRARFTPTMLNDQPVKVQGVITYNFMLQ